MSRPRVCPFVASAEARIRRLRRMLVLMLIVVGVGGRPIPTYAQAAAPIDGFFASQLLVDAGYEQNHVIYAVGRPHPFKAPCREILALVAQHPSAFLTDADRLFRDSIDAFREAGYELGIAIALTNSPEASRGR